MYYSFKTIVFINNYELLLSNKGSEKNIENNFRFPFSRNSFIMFHK